MQILPNIKSDITSNNQQNVFDEEQYINNTTMNQKIIQNCFKAQKSLNPLFDKGYKNEYLQARKDLYPESVRGSINNKNRAGDKLMEMLRIANIQINNLEYIADICSIPGSWTCFIINKNSNVKSILLSKKIEDKEDYYEEIKKSQNCHIIYGVDGGNVYQFENLKQYLQKIQELKNIKKDNIVSYTPGLDLFLADGGFQINLYQGIHVEHLQETITQRLFLSQILYGLYSIKNGASMIIKCFDCCGNFNIQMLHLVSLLFDSISISKPKHSRITNSEKYIIFNELQANEDQIQQVINILQQFYLNYSDNQCFKQIYNQQLTSLKSYIKFCDKINETNEIFMKKQTTTLNSVVSRTYHIINYRKKDNSY